MTQYATTSDLSTYGLGPRIMAGVSSSVADAALTTASSMADSYLMARYEVPLLEWPEALRLAVVNIASYIIMSGSVGFNPDGSHEQIRLRYDDGVRFLRDISKGIVTLATAETAPPRGPTPRAASKSGEGW